MFDLTGKTAVVTGGTGILGRCFCAGLAEFGANVVIIDIDETTVLRFANELSDKYGVTTLGLKCDTSLPKEVSNAFNDTLKVNINASQIDLRQEINLIGEYKININLHAEVTVSVNLQVDKIEST